MTLPLFSDCQVVDDEFSATAGRSRPGRSGGPLDRLRARRDDERGTCSEHRQNRLGRVREVRFSAVIGAGVFCFESLAGGILEVSTKESDDAKVRLGSRFHRLFGATLVSSIGTGMHAAALPLLALQSTSSPMALSFVVMAAEIPWVLLSPHAGVVVDRLDRRRVMVWADLGRFAVLVALAVLIVTAQVIFFFQAEDGIRDLYETGVQTCALPISPLLRRVRRCRTSCTRARAGCVPPVP